ncbi:hypothetical protein E2C01_095798 [Portunus trituberculatus]|uniref:Uncharacterized protein n=1 Tax=Portunus trituberculatus TaxID=210409 RepID=A0A5B7JQS4_PORTR|nr:hypothetical protein [Portunus trituberculatus]
MRGWVVRGRVRSGQTGQSRVGSGHARLRPHHCPPHDIVHNISYGGRSQALAVRGGAAHAWSALRGDGGAGLALPCGGRGVGRRPLLAPFSRWLAHDTIAEGMVPCARWYFERRRAAASPKKMWSGAHLVLNRNKARSREAVSIRGGESSSRPV